MPAQPLQPFVSPTALLSYLPSAVSGGFLLMVVLYAVFVFWGLLTLVAIYHWIKYSHASLITLPAIAVHLFVSFSLIAFTLSGTIYI